MQITDVDFYTYIDDIGNTRYGTNKELRYNLYHEWFRFGDKYTPKILRTIGINILTLSRIDGSPIIEIKKNYVDILKLTKYFTINQLNLQDFNDHVPIQSELKIDYQKNDYYKITGFSNQNWRFILERKEKLLKIKKIYETNEMFLSL